MIELKLGEVAWFETRNGKRAFVSHSYLGPWCLTGVVDERFNDSWMLDGKNSYSEAPLDLVRHLPNCTGWDWVEPKPEPKWRPFANGVEFAPHFNRTVRFISRPGDCLAHRINAFYEEGVLLTNTLIEFVSAFLELEFIDIKTNEREPFGIKEE